jgi:hypothetical protein
LCKGMECLLILTGWGHCCGRYLDMVCGRSYVMSCSQLILGPLSRMLFFDQVIGGMKKKRDGSCYTGFKPNELVFKPNYQVIVLTKKLRILMKIRI